MTSDQSEAAVSQCQPIRALCFGEDLAAGHGEGRPHTGGPVADKHRVGDLSLVITCSGSGHVNQQDREYFRL